MAEYDKLMNVNVRSMVALTQLCVPHLTVTKGAIVNVSSVIGTRAFPGSLAYNMSKALELAPKQIRVNSANPGVIPTEGHKRTIPGLTDQKYAQFLEHTKSVHALGRNGEVSEVARTIAFLASADASFITGAQVPVDGGWHLKCSH
ncbi:3-oxoacyl-[acyl-carrier-protein] reductase FabG-like [Branchiostoma floridae x Branchiostoma japonicum]